MIAACLERFRAASGLTSTELARQMAVLGAQRALRIQGVVARLEARGRRFPPGLVARVRGHLAASLRHPSLAALHRWCAAYYPPASEHG